MHIWAQFGLLVLSECVGVSWSRVPGPQNILHFLHGKLQAQNLHALQRISINVNSDNP